MSTPAKTFRIGDLEVNRLGFGAMRLTGKGIWDEPKRYRRSEKGPETRCRPGSSRSFTQKATKDMKTEWLDRRKVREA